MTWVSGWQKGSTLSWGISLYATGSPVAFRRPGLAIFQ